ncbi:MAG: VOC family protein [Verrucomicrobiales bacterium]|nr:VOC family protein [Verrucomicrobiales bacterium]
MMKDLRPTHIAETALYVTDLDLAADFYLHIFPGAVLHRDDRLCALRVAEEQVLLLFRRGASLQPTALPFGSIPPHDGTGSLHVCFGIGTEDVQLWEDRLKDLSIELESRVHWPGGAISLYFRDPDGHALELATPGLWRGFPTNP